MVLDEFGDLVESEVAVAVAATAALFSPRVRGLLRGGVVYGLAGLLTVGDMISSFARGAREGSTTGAQGLQDITDHSRKA